MTGARNLSGWCVLLVAGVTLFLSASVSVMATTKDADVDELKAHLASTSIADRPQLCLRIAERQLAAADKLYAALESEKAQASLQDVVAFSELARDYSLQSNKHQKQTEITVRKMARKLAEIKHTVAFDEQAALQGAITKLERVRDDLLLAMFPKKDKK